MQHFAFAALCASVLAVASSYKVNGSEFSNISAGAVLNCVGNGVQQHGCGQVTANCDQTWLNFGGSYVQCQQLKVGGSCTSKGPCLAPEMQWKLVSPTLFCPEGACQAIPNDVTWEFDYGDVTLSDCQKLCRENPGCNYIAYVKAEAVNPPIRGSCKLRRNCVDHLGALATDKTSWPDNAALSQTHCYKKLDSGKAAYYYYGH
mmetsp:Transcript_15524/g.27220  ORF Transcript_15524/g.27220 Transcript_15524/m.27220 type:complete len:203 (+) Transcript_15524:36-644(+)